jgi:hypothetical protein
MKGLSEKKFRNMKASLVKLKFYTPFQHRYIWHIHVNFMPVIVKCYFPSLITATWNCRVLHIIHDFCFSITWLYGSKSFSWMWHYFVCKFISITVVQTYHQLVEDVLDQLLNLLISHFPFAQLCYSREQLKVVVLITCIIIPLLFYCSKPWESILLYRVCGKRNILWMKYQASIL